MSFAFGSSDGGFLGRLLDRARGTATVVQPRPLALFEPEAALVSDVVLDAATDIRRAGAFDANVVREVAPSAARRGFRDTEPPDDTTASRAMPRARRPSGPRVDDEHETPLGPPSTAAPLGPLMPLLPARRQSTHTPVERAATTRKSLPDTPSPRRTAPVSTERDDATALQPRTRVPLARVSAPESFFERNHLLEPLGWAKLRDSALDTATPTRAHAGPSAPGTLRSAVPALRDTSVAVFSSQDLRPEAFASTFRGSTPVRQPARVEEQSVVNVTIGRLEVRAAATTSVPRAERTAPRAMSLDDYLKGRRGAE